MNMNEEKKTETAYINICQLVQYYLSATNRHEILINMTRCENHHSKTRGDPHKVNWSAGITFKNTETISTGFSQTDKKSL